MKEVVVAKKILLMLGCAVLVFFISTGYYSNRVSAATGAGKGVANFLSNLEHTVDSWDTYQFYKESENWKGKKNVKKVTMFRFKKPNLMRTDVLEGKKKGSVVLLNKEGEIRGTKISRWWQTARGAISK